MPDEATVCICTFNSASTLGDCLREVRACPGWTRLVVVDHESNDDTVQIAKSFGAEVFTESSGLGRARQLGLDVTTSRFIVFLDSDVEVVEHSFISKASHLLEEEGVGAVVGMARGHRYAYGLPASLLALRMSDFQGHVVPDEIDARETYYIQARLDKLKRRTVYIRDCIIHRSKYRGRKMEWEGANTRIAAGLSLRELAFCFRVMVLMSLNSHSVKNLAYVPIAYLHFCRGFVQPSRWNRLERVEE